jgi:hypothetical protein
MEKFWEKKNILVFFLVENLTNFSFLFFFLVEKYA